MTRWTVCYDSKPCPAQAGLLSHHGEPEFGAAVRPACAESELLSLIDMMDSRMEIYQEALEDVPAGSFRTPAKDDNAAPYHFDRRTLPIFKCVDYKTPRVFGVIQRPKVAPYILRMRENIASDLGIPLDAVSVEDHVRVGVAQQAPLTGHLHPAQHQRASPAPGRAWPPTPWR